MAGLSSVVSSLTEVISLPGATIVPAAAEKPWFETADLEDKVNAKALEFLRDEAFIAKINAKSYMALFQYNAGRSLPLNADICQMAAQQIARAEKCVQNIKNPSCIKNPRLIKARLIMTGVCGLGYIALTAIPSNTLVMNDSQSGTGTLSAAKIITAVATVYGALSPQLEKQKVAGFEKDLIGIKREIKLQLVQLKLEVNRAAISLIKDWVDATPCFGRPKMFTNLKNRGFFKDHAEKEAHAWLIRIAVSTLWKNTLPLLKKALVPFFRNEKDMDYVLQPLVKAVGTIQQECGIKTDALEELEILNDNPMLAILIFERRKQEATHAEKTESRVYDPKSSEIRKRGDSTATQGSLSDEKKDSRVSATVAGGKKPAAKAETRATTPRPKVGSKPHPKKA